MLERFEAEMHQAIDYRKCGYLFVLSNDKDVVAFKRNVDLQNQLGVQTEWLSGDEVRKRLPLMRLDDVIAGTFNPQDGLVDPNGVVMGYVSGAQRLGATALTNTLPGSTPSGVVKGVRHDKYFVRWLDATALGLVSPARWRASNYQ
jgi:sarcosine oxidase subunit beta